MQLYPADYLADTMHLDALQSGIYLHLLMNYWQTGKALVDDDRRLTIIAKCTPDQWLDNKQVIYEFFCVNDGKLTHKRIEKDLVRVKLKQKQCSEAGKASAEKRKAISNSCNERSTGVKQTLNEEREEVFIDGERDTTNCPHQQIIKIYHEILTTLPKVSIWTPARKKMLAVRWKEDKNRQSLKYWQQLFQEIAKSDFLMGKTKDPFTCNLEWIIRPTNFVKIIEGFYKNKTAGHEEQTTTNKGAGKKCKDCDKWIDTYCMIGNKVNEQSDACSNDFTPVTHQ